MRKTTITVALAIGVLAMILAPVAQQVALAQTAQPAQVAQPSAQGQVPQPEQGGVNWPGVGYGAGALFGNVLYIPAKLVYALLGGLVGGATWLVTAGNTQTADTVWRSSLGGDYVLTPQMIAGEQPINFSGPTETAPPPSAQASQPSGATQSGSVAPIQPIPASNASSGSQSQPIDRGNGSMPASKGGGLPDTSIE